MSKLEYARRVGTGHVKAGGETVKEVFQNVSTLEEVFGSEKCGKCGSTDFRHVVRQQADKKGKIHTYYELRCQARNCWARKSFGQHSENDSLFPHRKDEEGNYLPNDGWVVYNKDTGKNE